MVALARLGHLAGRVLRLGGLQRRQGLLPRRAIEADASGRGQLVPLHCSQSQNAPRRAASTATIAVSASDHDHRHRTVRIHPWIRTESPPGLSRHEVYAGFSPLTHVPISVHLTVRLWCSDAPLHWTARGSAGVRSRDRVGYEQTGTLARARRCFI